MIWIIIGLVLLEVVTLAGGVRFQTSSAFHEAYAARMEEHLKEVFAEKFDAEERHQEIEAKLREQVQHMAEKLATLRVEAGAAPEVDRFVKDPEPREPLSQQLQEFMNGIQYEDARVLLEEEIDILRSQDATDEQIYDIISKGND